MPTTVSRLNTNCVKWDEAPAGVLPMWVADMDFATAPCVQQAVMRRAQHPCYGYTITPDAYYDAIIDWQWRRHNWRVDRETILYTIGVVPAISAIVKAVTMQGDKVILLTPVYNCFFSSVRNAGCQVEDIPLLADEDDSRTGDGTKRLTYRPDYDALEAAASDPKTTTLIFCNPHNPTCHCWTTEELRRVAGICARHGVFVISDEIHCELTRPGLDYNPWAVACAGIEHQYAVCTSPSKAFNVAGLQNANIICPDADIRRRIDRIINIYEICDVNPFGIEALIAAYSHEGEVWLDELRQYIFDNYTHASQALISALPEVRIAHLDATYLMWVDVRAYLHEGETIARFTQRLMDEDKLWVNAGTTYGPAGEGFVRINLATSRENVEEGLRRLICGLQK